MTRDIECPIADIQAILDQYGETTQMRIVAFLFARLISPRATPKEVLTQLGEQCPQNGESDDEREAAGPVVHVERLPARCHPIRPGDGGRRSVPGASPQAPMDPAGAARDAGESKERA